MKKLIVFDLDGTLADGRIRVARLDVPDSLLPGGGADPPEAKGQRARTETRWREQEQKEEPL